MKQQKKAESINQSKYSVAMPLPSQGITTPGAKSSGAKKGASEGVNPKQLQFVDRIHEETTIDGENSVSTGPSNSGLDMIVANHNQHPNTSRQQKFNRNYRTTLE